MKIKLLILLLSILATSCLKENNLYVESGELTTFKFERANNPQLSHDIVLTAYGNNRLTGYLTEEINTSSLIPTFEINRGKLYIKDELQISQKSANNFNKVIRYTLKGDNGKSTEYAVTLVPYTGLPVAIIHTNNEIPLKDKDTWISAQLEINGMGNLENFKDSIQIKGRGNATWNFPKKPFNIKLNNKAEILGMPKQKRWSFLANYRDRTLLRNDVTFHIGQIADKLEWTPKSQFVEVIFNGEYQGNFQLCEQIRVDKNRVNIKEMTSEDIDAESITGGYLLEYDSYFDEINKFKSEINKWPVNVKSPDEDILKMSQLQYIKDFTNTLESLLQAQEYAKVYQEYINMDTFIDYWIVQTLVGNREMNKIYSVYCYKDRNKKLCAGPLWDFDFSTFTLDSDNSLSSPIWYRYLFNDPIFKQKVKERFAELKPKFELIPAYIDSQSMYLKASVETNWSVFPINFSYFTSSTLNQDETLTHSAAIDRMKYIYNSRLEWLEREINKL